MKKLFIKSVTRYLIIGTILITLACFPKSTFAAELSFKIVPNVPGDQATTIEVSVDPQGKDLNVVEGVISLEGTSISSSPVVIQTGGSLLTYWLLLPTYSSDEKVIRFTGGKPRGFTMKGPIFRIRISNPRAGSATISWLGGSAYLNDGNGTKETISSKSLVVSFAPHDANIVHLSTLDTKPPQFDVLELAQDPNTYDGNYFLTFHATDDITGVLRYVVKEGQETTVVTNGVYILKHQDQKTPVFITVYDQVGNTSTVEFSPRYQEAKNGILIALFSALLLGVLLFLGIHAYRKIKK